MSAPPDKAQGKVGQAHAPVGQVQTPVGQALLPAQPPPGLTITRRRLPHWRLDDSIYFITFRLKKNSLSPEERNIVLGRIRAGDPTLYHLLAAVVMPDHVHMLLRPNPGVFLARITKGIKGVSARLVNKRRGTRGALWQDESWDRIVRHQKELLDKIDYMLHNPAKAGLAKCADEYDAWYWSGETDLADQEGLGGQTGVSAPPQQHTPVGQVQTPVGQALLPAQDKQTHARQTGVSAPPMQSGLQGQQGDTR